MNNILENNSQNLKCNCVFSFKSYIHSLEKRIKNLIDENNTLKSENVNLKKERDKMQIEVLGNTNNSSQLTREISILKEKYRKTEEEILENYIKELNSNLKIIIKNAVKSAGRPSSGKRYDPKLKTIALGTYFFIINGLQEYTSRLGLAMCKNTPRIRIRLA